MFTTEERVYLVQCYSIRNLSYKNAIDLFHHKCRMSQEESSENYLEQFTELSSVINMKKPRKHTTNIL